MLFCIVGSGRCGSTLLMRMLNEHPEVHVLNETHWIPKLYEFFGAGRAGAAEMLDVVDRTHHVNGQPTTVLPAHARAAMASTNQPVTVREFADEIGTHLASASGKAIWADKTPDYFCYMGVIQSIWPDCRFVHLIRDGAQVAHSMADHPGYRVLVAEGEVSWVSLAYGADDMRGTAVRADPDVFFRLWRWRVERARTESTRLKTGSYIEVRFEDVCAEPQETLAAIAAFAALSDAAGRWVEAATELVNPERVDSRFPHQITTSTDAGAIELMMALGYGASLT